VSKINRPHSFATQPRKRGDTVWRVGDIRRLDHGWRITDKQDAIALAVETNRIFAVPRRANHLKRSIPAFHQLSILQNHVWFDKDGTRVDDRIENLSDHRQQPGMIEMTMRQDHLLDWLFAIGRRDAAERVNDGQIVADIHQRIYIVRSARIAAEQVRIAGEDHALGIDQVDDAHLTQPPPER